MSSEYAHKEQITKSKLILLQKAAKQIMDTMVNDFDISTFGSVSEYNNWQKLRYHGLIAHKTDQNGNRVRGHWLITRNGWAFLRGELSIPKYVLVKDNHIIDRSDSSVSIKDIWYGSEIIQTTFEYFDSYGRPIGFKPISKPKPHEAESMKLL